MHECLGFQINKRNAEKWRMEERIVQCKCDWEKSWWMARVPELERLHRHYKPLVTAAGT